MTRPSSELQDSTRPKKKLKLSPSSSCSNSVFSDEIALFQSASAISTSFNSVTDLDTASVTVSHAPFPSIVFNHLFSPELLSQVKQELLSQPYYHRQSDLFSYYGTNDLSTSIDTPIAQLRNKLYSSEFTDFLTDATGVDLTSGKVDMSSHIYKRGDWLGCHDDDITSAEEGRRIAFIIYLVDEDWSEKDGGALALFDLDAGGNPGKIKHSIAPKWNRMALFEVTPSSFHEVREVTTSQEGRFRLSISGWFHGPLSTRLALRNFLPLLPNTSSTEELVNPKYRNPSQRDLLLSEFIESSVLTLPDFLNPNLLSSLNAEWSDEIGPASVRRFRTLRKGKVLEKVRDWFASVEGWEFIKSLTGAGGEEKPRCRAMVRQFGRGCYTMIHDHALDPLGLDAILCLGPEEWDPSWGGSVVYTSSADSDSVSNTEALPNGKQAADGTAGETNGTNEVSGEESEEDGELMRAQVTRNTLTLVLRDKGTLRYVERVNCRAEGARVDIEALYRVQM